MVRLSLRVWSRPRNRWLDQNERVPRTILFAVAQDAAEAVSRRCRACRSPLDLLEDPMSGERGRKPL